MTRLLTVMGSGETAPTMAKVHRALVERVGLPAVLLDTPYGFQENADDISARAQEYFRQSVGHPIDIASLRSSLVDAVTAATAIARLRAARYVFAGPGSPTYALRTWVGTAIPGLLAEKLAPGGAGGAVTFASAASLTLGVATVPVYEIYKAGEPPAWLPGLNVLEAVTGLRAAVIPHFDNAEGGHHDTRFCYLGERRLSVMEAELPAGAFVLGVDEHTGLTFDLDAGTATVTGLGTVTVRVAGRVVAQYPSGTVVPIDEVQAAAEGHPAAGVVPLTAEPPPAAGVPPVRSPLLDETDRLDAAFGAALAGRDVTAAVQAILELEQALVDWSADTLQGDEADRARSVLRSMIVRLGEVAVEGARDPREVVAPYIDLLLALRSTARDARDWATSDAIRDGLAAAGVEVRDTPSGATWALGG